MPIPSRAGACVLASSLLLAAAPIAAQTQQEPRGDSLVPEGPRDTRLQTRRSGTGRDQFIAPVMGIQIEGDGLNLPPEAAEADTAKAPAKPAAEAKPAETKEPEARSTGK